MTGGIQALAGFRWLLFDLGGVLADYAGIAALNAWLPYPAEDWEIARLWHISPAVRAFESGQISPVIFAYEIISEFGLNIHPDDFLAIFPDFVIGWHPGAEEFLASLSPRHSLALLANTNSLQWDKLVRQSPVDRLFRRTFLSHRTGLIKPDQEAYIDVIGKLKCDPDTILFFDDSTDNVRGALDAGLEAVLVTGFGDLKRHIGRMGL